MGLLKILTFELYILSKIIPLCQDPHLTIFTNLILIMGLPNKTESVIDYRKHTRWPDCQVLFEMDPAYQSKVSLEQFVSGNIWFNEQNPTEIPK